MIALRLERIGAGVKVLRESGVRVRKVVSRMAYGAAVTGIKARAILVIDAVAIGRSR